MCALKSLPESADVCAETGFNGIRSRSVFYRAVSGIAHTKVAKCLELDRCSALHRHIASQTGRKATEVPGAFCCVAQMCVTSWDANRMSRQYI